MAESWGGIGSTINVNNLSEIIRHAAQDLQGFAQLCNPPTGGALGKNRGDTQQYTYFPNISVSGGQLTENEEIPEGSLTPVSGSYTLAEYGNAIAWTGKLETLSRLDVEDGFTQALCNDMRKAQNTAAYTQFDASVWTATPAATNVFEKNSLTGVATLDLSLAFLRFVVKKARANLIPYFDGESYVYITGPESLDAVRYDSAVSTMLQYDSGRAALNGECGRIAQCRLVEDTHKIAKVGGTSSGAGLNLDKGYLVGADAVINEYALPPEVRAQDKDFGRSWKVAWYFIAAWKKIYSHALHSKEHVVKIASA